ncbi:metal-sensitive transcriptional regulator [Helcobacillus massiliensis]|uniref:DNA-binding FrmR family transcriptional regulator n=1 Tax=Helcobacillus massiliensis TaxID=521392 RepID=A0A839QUC8_9MICO|nr:MULTISPECIES: metal-sensitive transcriptional regulator [Helcobacillus]MBB3023248.1 DNA-binding FrmR family transcriptional regulator [Helcobacillus massiliensis]MCG7427684.1 metal-sensitive transcriptional regulator [Helcobacillus sp. ACRRO]MCT1556577.1 metal-sensitive transcriptional regulator [Helcobacillus massiliensis]MCT2035771.1 metal-sensitive transcriptional regulator [Helcobacillus massiliensis]MCT2331147.1 metal-sensitive transcriptional regulator [Helcobacillus massiliensis]
MADEVGPGYHDAKSKYLARLKRIEGQVRGLHRMVDEDTYCIDVLTQIAATTKALESVSLALVEDHMHHCVHDAVASEDSAVIEEKLDEVLAAMRRLM